MAIDKSKNTRIVVTVSHEIKDKLKEVAKEENRTVANLINTIVLKYFKEIEENKKTSSN
ncbi:Uncharacterised protein [Clostridium baratii]|uniref:ribbon-helix-helix domain-containing protein n=1 Tax=Clostridium baratii TaxID=1561 RepID=UPI0006C37CF7|nr:DNA-binding protein [Clostridium baratii]CUP04742.1 Uncharacterised protein [Clostridium baratii]